MGGWGFWATYSAFRMAAGSGVEAEGPWEYSGYCEGPGWEVIMKGGEGGATAARLSKHARGDGVGREKSCKLHALVAGCLQPATWRLDEPDSHAACAVMCCRAKLLHIVLGLSRHPRLAHVRLGTSGMCDQVDLPASSQPACKADHCQAVFAVHQDPAAPMFRTSLLATITQLHGWTPSTSSSLRAHHCSLCQC